MRLARPPFEPPIALGADLTGFKLIAKGGSKKKQVWQLSCPTAIYFVMLDSKRADAGKTLFVIMADGEEVLEPPRGELCKRGSELPWPSGVGRSDPRASQVSACKRSPPG